jgi:hypothetical protein
MRYRPPPPLPRRRYRVTVREYNGQRFVYYSATVTATGEASARIKALTELAAQHGRDFRYQQISEVEVIG